MARDIEEFLRRAAERRRQQQQKKRAPAPRQSVRDIIEQQEIEVVEPVEIVYPEEVKPRPPIKRSSLRQQSVSEHVSSHIDSSDIADHADHLGDRILSVDDKVAARIKRKFSHDVSHIDDLPTVLDDKVATATKDEVSQIAVDLVRMLQSPQSVRQAVMISEILKRPSFDD